MKSNLRLHSLSHDIILAVMVTAGNLNFFFQNRLRRFQFLHRISNTHAFSADSSKSSGLYTKNNAAKRSSINYRSIFEFYSTQGMFSFGRAVFVLFISLVAVKGFGQPAWQTFSSVSGDATSFNIAKPSGTVENDLMVVAIYLEKGSGVTVNSVPTGWMSILANNQGSDFGMRTFYKVAGASEGASYTFGLSTSGKFAASNSRISGVNTSSPINIFGGGGSSTGNTVSPSIDPTVANTLILSFHGRKNTGTMTVGTAPPGTTKQFQINGSDVSNMLATFNQASDAATGTVTTSGGSSYWNTQQIAIAPPCTAPTVPTASATPSTICAGESSTLSITGGSLNDATQWQWYTVSCGGTPLMMGTSIMVSPTMTTTYYVRGEGGCVTPGACAEITVTVNEVPVAGAPTTANVCVDGTTDIDGNASGGMEAYTHAWTITNAGGTGATNGSNLTNANAEIVTFNATGLTAGTVTLLYTVTDANTCSGTKEVTVTVAVQPIGPTLDEKTPDVFNVCEGTNVSATINSGTGGVGCEDIYEYSTDNGSNWLPYTSGASISTTGATVVLIQGKRDECETETGCTGTNFSTLASWTVIAQPTGPTIDVQTPTNTTICAGEEVSATFNAGSGGDGCADDFILIVDGGTPVAYTPGSNVGGAATSSIVIQGRRENCTPGSGCGTNYVTLASWTVIAQPTGPTLDMQSPTNATICAGQEVSATFNAGSGGDGCTDDFIVIIDGGTPDAYTPGSDVGGAATSSIVIQGRRNNCTSGSGCGSNYVMLASWTVIAQPTGPTLDIQTPANSTICTGQLVSATFNSGSGGDGCADDFIVIVDGGTPDAYTPGSDVGGAATSSIVIQGRRDNCTSGSGCGTNYVTLASWTVIAQPTGPTLDMQTPGNTTICAGQEVSATFNTGSGGDGCADDFIVIIDGGTPDAYTPGSDVGGAATSSIVIQGRRDNCTSGSGCGTNYVTLASWTVIAQPTGPTLDMQTPGNATICTGQVVSATFNTGSGGDGCADDFIVIVDGGTPDAYTPGSDVGGTATSSIVIQGRRDNCTSGSGCGTNYVTLASWAVVAQPIGPTLDEKTPDVANVCEGTDVSATITPGTGGVGCTDTYEYSTNGGSSFDPYVSGDPIETDGATVVLIRAKRDNCESGTGCTGTNFVTLASWTVDELPVVSNQPNQAQCDNGSFTMTQSTPAVGAGEWSLESGTATITDENDPVTTVTDVPAGTSAIVRWTVTNGTCTAFDEVTLTNDEQVTTPDAGSPQSKCEDGTFMLAGNSPTSGSGLWTCQDGCAGVVITTPTSPTSAVTGVVAGTTAVLRWTITNGACVDFDEVELSNRIQPAANAGTDQTICFGGTATLAANTPPQGTGTWSVVSGPNTNSAQFDDVNDPTAVFTPVGGDGQYILSWTITNEPCDPHNDEVQITVLQDVNFGTITSANQTLCSGGNPANITLSTPPSGGAGTFSYQWYTMPGIVSCPTGSDITGWAVVGGATTDSYDPPTGLTASTTYALFVTPTGMPDCGPGEWATGCRQVTINNVFGGTIQASQTICSGGDPDPIIELVASSGSGTLSYIWLSSTTSCSEGSSVLGGQTNATYDPPSGMTSSTFYRRTTVSTLNSVVCNSPPSNCVTITVNNVTGGTIAGNQTVCEGGDPAEITQTVAATGTGALTYYWESSTTDCSSGFTTIPDATGSTYDPEVVNETTYFRRITVSTHAGVECEAMSNCVTVTVVADPVITISGGANVCVDGNITLTADASEGTGTCTIQWQVWVDDDWEDIDDENDTTFDPPTNTEGMTDYRATYSCTGSGCDLVSSNTQTVSVVAELTIEIDGGATVCVEGEVTLTADVSVAAGTCTIQWQSYDGVDWNDIDGATDEDYDPPTDGVGVTQYRATYTCTGGGCDPATSNQETVTVVADPSITISGGGTVCENDNITLTATPSGGTGDCDIQWQSFDGVDWNDIVGQNALTFDPPTDIPGATDYRAIYDCEGEGCDASPSNTQTVTVDEQHSVSDQPDQVQCGDSDFTMTQSAPSPGTGVWSLEAGTAMITDDSDPMTTVTGVSVGTSATLRWTVTSGTCTAFDDVVLTNNAGPNVINTTTGDIFCSIQEAIDDAATLDGHVIVASAGTFNENIVVTKGVSLRGANYNVTCDGARGTETVLLSTAGSASIVVTIVADGVTINGFTVTNPLGTYGIVSNGYSNIDIRHNIITDIGNNVDGSFNTYGIGIVMSPTADIDDVNISNNCINDIRGGENTSLTGNDAKANNGSAGGMIIGFAAATNGITGLTINSNIIDNITASTNIWDEGGKGAYGVLINVGASSTGEAVTPVVSSNEITGLEGLWAHGIGLEGKTPGALVTNNYVDDLTGHLGGNDANGVKVEANTGAGTVQINNNSFTNMVLGINNVTASSVDGTCNWFGSDNEPTVALAVSANVVYIPFLTSGTDDMPGTTGFQPEAGSCVGYPSDLYVDDDSNTDDLFTPGVTGSDITGNGTATAPFRTIQKAIDVAATTGTKIWVDAGLYAENVNVNKEVEIEGAGQLLTTVVPAISNPSGNSLSSAIFYIQADNVTIHDLTADGKNDAITGVGDIDASTGIITDWNAGDGDHTNLEVYNVTVRDVYLRGIQATYNFAADNTFSIHNNTIDGVQGDPDESIGIFNYGSTGTIENNTILEASTGIYSFSSHHSTISGNDITNVTNGTGIVSNFNGEGGGFNLADVISDNTITGGDYGVQVANAYLNVEITGNTINGSAVAGISVQGGVGTGEVNIHDNAATITGAAIGVDIDGGTASLYRNNIHTNGIGVQVINGGELTSATENFIRTNTGDGIHIAVSAGPVSMIHDNDLSGNGGLAINNLSGTPVASSCNWYGSDEEATVATEVSADVVFIPFLTNGMDDDDMTAGFQPVPASCTGYSADLYVDDDSNTGDVFTPGATGSDITGNGTVTAPFRTIQKAIDVAAATGAKIWVDAGLYAENVEVNKEVEIEGAGQLLTTVVPAISNPGGSSLSSAIFYIQADNIIIHDLTVDGKNDAITGVGDIDASTGIITDWNAGDGDHTNLEVYNVTVRDVYLRGIQATYNEFDDNTFNIHDNIINGVQGDPAESVALLNWGSTGTFDNNTISNSTTGIYSFSSHHTTISNNNISNATNGTGIVSNFNGEGGGTNTRDLISGNTVNLGAHGIHVANAYLNVEITGNTVTNSTVSGILIEGEAGTGVVNIHNNTATITGAVIGVDISGGTASLHRNDIYGNGTGVRVTDGGELTFATENFIRFNAGHGILIDTDAGDVGGIHDNDLSGNTSYAINNLSMQIIDATCNWYGSDVAATVANEVSGNLAFVPYLTDGTDDGMDTGDGFQPLDGVCDGSMITTEAEDMMVQCDGAGNTAALNAWLADNGGAEAIDICDGFGWSNDFTALSDLCGETGSATVIFTVSDDCGNMSTTSATFTIFDSMAPTGTAPASTSGNNVCYNDVLTTFPFVPATVAMNYTDACSGSNVTANLTSTTFFGDDCGWILIYAFSVSDACGNSLSGQTITHTGSDMTAPTGSQPTPSLNNNACKNSATTTYPFNAMTAAAGYSDNCGAGVTAILTNTQVLGTDCNWGIIYTFRVEDACGNSMTGQQMLISGSDQTDPVADQGATALNVTLECDDADGLTDALAAAPTFTDACDLSVPAVMQSNMSTIGVDPEACTFYNYTITRTWTGTDDCGNTSDVYTQVITVQDTEGPVANEGSDALDVTLECDDDTGLTAALAMAPTFADNCDPTAPTVLQSTISTKGEDAEVCTFYNYTITRTWTATDACGNTSDVYTQVITVQDTEAPVANEASDELDVTLECDDADGLEDALEMAPTFADNCDPTAPTVMQSTISTKGEDAEVCTFYNYTITRTWTATDACGNTSDVYTQVITVQDIDEPVAIETSDALDVTLECDDADGLDDALALAPTFADNCDPTAPAVLQSSISTKGEDSELCTFYNYTITRTWTATDACGNTSDVYTQVITVEDTTAPVANEESDELDVTLQCEDEAGLTAALAMAPSFADNCDPTAPTEVVSSMSTKGEDDTECDFYTYTITRTWTATDACGNTSDVYTQVITVEDTNAPVANEESDELDVTLECDDADGLEDALELAPTFTDNCNPTVTPVLLNTISTKGEDDTDCDFYNYTITRTWSATDACNNTSAVYTQVITVQDTEAPVVTEEEGALDETLECDDEAGLTAALALAPTFTDNCNPTATPALLNSVSTKGEDDTECDFYTYTITRTWSATDACNNTSDVYTQVITVQDTEAPLVTEGEGDLDETVECDDEAGLLAALALAPTFTDNCNPTATPELLTSVSTKGEDDTACDFYNYTITRTWYATDACNNTSDVYTQVITVQDTEAPLADQAGNDLDVVLECDDADGMTTALAMAPTFSDNCNPTATPIFGSTMTTKGEDPTECSYYTYAITRTWTATDVCGNTSSVFTQTIWVEDMTDPTVDAPTATELECSTDIPDAATTITEFLALTGADASDNCAAEENLSVSSNTGVLDGEECSGTITRTYSISDPCGNITMVDHVFNVSDNTDPEIAAGELDDCYETVAEAEAAALALTMANATDNCTGELSFDVDLMVDPENPMCDSLITVTVTDACMNSSMIEYTTRISCQQVRLKVYLEGAYNSMQDTMRTTLNNDHLLPGQINTIPFVANTPPGHPYSLAPHNYNDNTGLNFGDGVGDTPYPEDVVDWVLVKVREDGIGPLDNIWTCAGWVHSDGRVTFPETCEELVIDEDKDYHIVVQHRNHLGVLSTGNLMPGMGVNINCDGAYLNWDFTVADSYKPPFRVGQKLVGGRWVMFGANGEQVNSIQVISSPDRTIWAQQQGQNGYKTGDYNMNHTVDGPDETMWKQNQNRTSGIIFY